MKKQLPIIYQNILTEITASQHVMLVTHQNPDGDAVGSTLAMAHFLENMQKPYTCFCVDAPPKSLAFLPGVLNISNNPDHWLATRAKFDLLIALDAGDLKHAGITDYLVKLKHKFKIINIDHHVTNKNFGHHNLVDPTASSACEIVHEFLSAINALNKKIADCLLTGLITDTGGFTNLATNASAIGIASKLLLQGANLPKITTHTLQNRSVFSLRLWGRALERLQTSPSGMVVTVITQKDLTDCHATEEDVSGVANFLNSLDEQKDARAILVLTEQNNNKVKGSLRTTHPLMDVAKFATILGGGGHKKAAGFTLSAKLFEKNGKYYLQKLTNK
ncbi:MAG: hypothetical protein A2233_04650 [Candidatus Kerfeldbacteria bacterium RIFOXYA2_FULL_38_24]|uniref:DDH domain-containing protein n=1 Tax=Candidatus Kerfeldbacteria bacterium RIFOXYB2_FULL_38_14 TaxID=1798547 RepID=A0A1G2BHA9_9BACT|nr:MAG: hypothetical protein A2319_02430 [Candidatus Kerfeldbacteria bacterium RIFOXYB2_FULL_38_14]OGY88161.1 MAG: hypothetical protein A2233_04650 [Candidatus Kerfeldbacteria bacterium RIFOXYA2_FULL_38_24]OGY89181.1 MAG: hypothetical protein A2458_01125 [Candidatus Kerfeldbacteria bacterium RIFOXYC2_FULL_38_9]